MSKTFSPAALMALQEALTKVYWYKSDLRKFLEFCIKDKTLLLGINWKDDYKRIIVGNITTRLIDDGNNEALTTICYELCKLTSFDHLKKLDDSETKIKEAKMAIHNLKKMVEPHQEIEQEKKEAQKRAAIAKEKREKQSLFNKNLSEIHTNFLELVISNNPQQRGFKLEKLMYDLFNLFDLDPKASFKIKGQQIDGAFTLDGTEYLFEAKWQKEPIDFASLSVFKAKVNSKLENTLGLFLSIDGFSVEGIQSYATSGRSSIFLMDGSDLIAILEQRVDFRELLAKKKRIASQTGNIYVPFYQLQLM